MSRSGRIPINIPDSTQVRVEDDVLYAKGKLGELSFDINRSANVNVNEKQVIVKPFDDSKVSLKMWGTIRSQINNTILGVTNGFEKELQLNGVGYKAALKGKILELLLGFSHPINFPIPEDIKIELPKPTQIKISGISKQKVGQIAADIRSYRKPEPYKGKGVKYSDEIIRRKEGKKK
tara:strand:- start:1942 stop:2475 length:534 start_codon:yes stop_codon:yes gene_type:complete